MTDPDQPATIAVWYLHHGSPDYWDEPTEQEAADTAARIDLYTDDTVLGAQFADGRLVTPGNWPAYQQATLKTRQRRDEQEQVRPETRPTRRALAPFVNTTVIIDADEPAWIGLPLPEARP